MHFFELLRILEDDGGEDVETEAEIVVFDGQIRVEKTQTDLHCELAQQQASHPLKVHVVEIDVLAFEMLEKLRIHSLYHLLYPHE